MTTPKKVTFDSVVGIASQLGSYAAFYALMKLRLDRGRDRDGQEYGKLTPYVILGRYHTDAHGQCSRLSRSQFTDDHRKAMKSVMTMDEWQTFLKQVAQPNDAYAQVTEGTHGTSPSFPLAPPHVNCKRCAKGWELETCHDMDAEMEIEDIPASDGLVGMNLKETLVRIQERTDAMRYYAASPRSFASVRNPKWVDPAADPEFADNEELGNRDQNEDYVLQAGDSVQTWAIHYYHGPCYRKLQAERAQETKEEQEAFLEAFDLAGFTNITMNSVNMPQIIVDFFADELDKDIDADVLASVFKYMEVKTDQGTFAVFKAAYPMISLVDSNVSLSDLDPKCAADLPEGFPPIIGFTGELGQIARLRQLMAQANQAPPAPQTVSS